jgi:phosphomevalonate kinase
MSDANEQTPSSHPIIGLSGKQFAGKDAATAYLLKRLPQFRQIPLAGAIKLAYAKQHGLTLEALEANKAKHRPGLIELGDWGRAPDPDYWLKQALVLPGPKIISDVRMRREYDVLRQAGAFLIRVTADRSVRADRGQLIKEEDPTERDLDDVAGWDAVITNNSSLKALHRQLDDLLERGLLHRFAHP